MSDQFKSPPKFLSNLLKWIYDESLINDVTGDLTELYQDRLARNGQFLATLYYTKDIILSMRNLDLKERKVGTSYSFDLYRNYFKSGVRNIIKNPSSSGISIVGLSLAIGCALTAFRWTDFDLTLDEFHTQKSNIYQVISHIDEEGTDQRHGSTPLHLANHLLNDHSSVRNAVRMHYAPGIVRFGKRVFNERVMFADPDFLGIFDFPLIQGNRSALTSKNSIVISEEIALKYFGESDPLGKEITIKHNAEYQTSYQVTAVLSNRPVNSSFRFDIIIPFSNYLTLNAEQEITWEEEVRATFVLLQPGTNPNELTDLLTGYRTTQNATNSKKPYTHFELISLEKLANLASEITNPVAYGNSSDGTFGIAFMGVLLLLLACINYINLAVSTATGRLKEIGIRKVIGSSRKGIIAQFLTEHAILTLASILLGSIFYYLFFLPGFKEMSGIEIPYQFSSWQVAIYFYFGLFFFVGLASGSYPALYVSKFDSTVILKGGLRFGGKSIFSRILLTLQFFMSFTVIIGSFFFTANGLFLKKTGWGYDPKNVISIRVQSTDEYLNLKNIAIQHSGILTTAGSNGHVGVSNPTIVFDYLNNRFNALHYEVGPSYDAVMKLNVLEGRFFLPDNEENDVDGVVVNRKFVEKMGWDDPLEQQIDFLGRSRNILGVIENMHHVFFTHDEIRPMIFTYQKNDAFEYLVVRSSQEQHREVDQYLQTAWAEISPEDPFHRVYQSEIFQRHYQNVDANITLMVSIAVMSIILSCLGLYGLVSLRMQRRAKEFGIRKVLGANMMTIAKLANKEYFWILFISFGLGAPLGTVLILDFLEKIYSVTKPFDIMPVVIALIICFGSILLTVYHQVNRATHINPADVLRDE